MNNKEIENKFILGGAVSYQGKMCAVIGMNKLNNSFTLEELSGGKVHNDIKADEVEDGEDSL